MTASTSSAETEMACTPVPHGVEHPMQRRSPIAGTSSTIWLMRWSAWPCASWHVCTSNLRTKAAPNQSYLHLLSPKRKVESRAGMSVVTRRSMRCAVHWSSGPVEGNINRLKLIKRQMYGRGGFDLLRKRVLLAS